MNRAMSDVSTERRISSVIIILPIIIIAFGAIMLLSATIITQLSD